MNRRELIIGGAAVAAASVFPVTAATVHELNLPSYSMLEAHSSFKRTTDLFGCIDFRIYCNGKLMSNVCVADEDIGVVIVRDSYAPKWWDGLSYHYGVVEIRDIVYPDAVDFVRSKGYAI